jgi:phosphoribosylformimino-5-aminoimidazole carboxamide ribotide isomerase
MELIPVLDLLQGQAVHARGGLRDQYHPVESALLPGRPGDAVALARAYRELPGVGHCYVADLDAIQQGSLQRRLLAAIVAQDEGFGPGLMVDAGVTTPAQAVALLELGAEMLVVGLETLRSFGDLQAIVREAGGERVLFGLDLMDGKPLRRRTRRIATYDAVALELGARAADAGCAGILVLDLATVGSGAGPRNLELLDALKRMLGVRIYAGGGVRSAKDLEQLALAGCHGALVGTAIHSGVIRQFPPLREADGPPPSWNPGRGSQTGPFGR